MARVPRIVLPDGATHVFSRGNRREHVYLTTADARDFLWRATEAFERFEVECWTYCLMPTHYHFLLHARREHLSRAMHRLNGGYAQRFNREHGFRGHLFGDRFGAREILDERQLLEVVRYIVLNPVRAGLCAHPANWRWSSYAATAGLDRPPALLNLNWMRDVISPTGFAEYVALGLAELAEAA
jgi:putative transposase